MSDIGKLSYRCAARDCRNAFYVDIINKEYKNKSFFRFPEKDNKRREKWFEIMTLPSVKTRVYLCMDHFEEKSFCDSSKTRLTKFALPFFNKPHKKINILSNILLPKFENSLLINTPILPSWPHIMMKISSQPLVINRKFSHVICYLKHLKTLAKENRQCLTL